MVCTFLHWTALSNSQMENHKFVRPSISLNITFATKNIHIRTCISIIQSSKEWIRWSIRKLVSWKCTNNYCLHPGQIPNFFCTSLLILLWRKWDSPKYLIYELVYVLLSTYDIYLPLCPGISGAPNPQRFITDDGIFSRVNCLQLFCLTAA